MKSKSPLPLLFFFLAFSTVLQGQQVKGIVIDTNKEPLPFASIYIKNSTLGVTTDAKGRYIFDLEEGTHILVYSYLGFRTIEQTVNLKGKEILSLDITLEEDPTELGEVQVVGDTKNLAKNIMSKARKNRKKYLNQLTSYRCQTYIKESLDRKLIKPSKSDTLEVNKSKKEPKSKWKKQQWADKKKEIAANREAFFDKDNLQLVETISEISFQSPNSYKEKILAQNDYAEHYHSGVSVTVYYGSDEIAPQQWDSRNIHLLYTVLDPIFNFYQNSIQFPRICSKPILSPLAFNAALNYTFDFEGSFYEEEHKVFKIKVIPRFKSDALFNGFIFIEDNTFAIKSVDLAINRPAMMGCRDFKILQNYEMVDGQFSVPVRREVVYTIKEGKENFIGHVNVRHSKYEFNQPFQTEFKRSEVKKIVDDAFEKDALFWVDIRPIIIKEEELKFMAKADSIRNHQESPAYKKQQDSIYNHINIWSILLHGVGHKNSLKGNSFYINGLIEQLRPFGVGGYRHNLSGSFRKEFSNNHILHLDGKVDYGFTNKDVKGRVGIGYTYYPKKFVRTFIRFGDYYDMINNYESVQALFSRSNYVRTKTYSIEQRMEFINGLFGELTLKYSSQFPITNIQLAQWSKDLFGELNAPADFDPYKKAEVEFRLQFIPFQKYYFHHNKKVTLGSDWPEFFLDYRKGLKGVLGSEVDYDYIEIGAQDYRRIGRFGYSNWAAKMGSFVNHRDLRFLEHKFFRGSDLYLFSDPLRSFQLLGPTLNTRNEFFRVNYLHHFDGTILNKLPLVRFLKLELAGGVSTLLIRDINFAHIEFFAGLERKVRLFREQFRFGVYGVTADNSLSNANISFKIGMNIFDEYTRKWSY